MSLEPTPGARMNFLIKRRPTPSREELVAHWFANHMPDVIAGQNAAREAGKFHAWRYIATLYDADRSGAHPWDGVAQLWFDQPLPKPDKPHGDPPRDSFQERAETYVPWGTTEYVVMADDAKLPVTPLTLNDPVPTTRSGFLKVTFLVATRPGADHDALFSHWLDVHLPNVRGVMEQVGGWRYVIGHSIDPVNEPFAGMAELYFDDVEAWKRYASIIQPDGMEEGVDDDKTLVLRSHTEMVGIP